MMVDGESLLYYLKLWDAYVGTFNAKASVQSGGAMHSSTLWLEADTYAQFAASTQLTLVLAISMAFVITCVSMYSFELSVYALLTQFSILAGIAFFMVVVCEW